MRSYDKGDYLKLPFSSEIDIIDISPRLCSEQER